MALRRKRVRDGYKSTDRRRTQGIGCAVKITAAFRAAVRKAAVQAADTFLDSIEQDTVQVKRTVVRAPAQPDAQPTPEEIDAARAALTRKAGVR